MAGERLDEQTMAMRAAREFADGMVVNLGVGIPTLCGNFVPAGREVLFHSENGVVGFGRPAQAPEEASAYLINPGMQPVLPRPGMVLMDHAESFCLVRGGWIDISVLGALEVSERGDLANYLMPGKLGGNLGGGQDLAFRAKRVIAVMKHTTRDGRPRLVRRVSLPLTAPAAVDTIVTDIAVIDVTPGGLILREHAPGWSVAEIQALTEPPLTPAPDLAEITLFD
jgi:3-oxoacid CoA-transferase B subunit